LPIAGHFQGIADQPGTLVMLVAVENFIGFPAVFRAICLLERPSEF
jgi:hypothetical protein